MGLLGLLLAVCLLQTVKSGGCPDGWMSGADDRCYLLSDYEDGEYGDYADGETWCSDRGGFLARITSQEQQDFINSGSIDLYNYPWIGAKYELGSWLMGGEPISFDGWYGGEPTGNSPTGNSEDCSCGYLDNGGAGWTCGPCSDDPSNYLCERAPEEPEPEPEPEEGAEVGTSEASEVSCGKFTNRRITIGSGGKSIFRTKKETRRCVVTYSMDSTCSSMRLSCNRFFLPNMDGYRCRRGDKLLAKIDKSKPRGYCNREKPTDRYPAVSFEDMKVWYTAQTSQLYPNKGATCIIVCAD